MHRFAPACRSLLLAGALGLAVPAGAQSPPDGAASAAAAPTRLQRIEALRAQRPNDGLLVYYQALALIEAGRRDEGYALLRSLVGRGLGIVPAQGIGFEPVWDDTEFQGVRRQLAADEARTAPAPVAFALRERLLVPEGIAWDAQGRRFFLGSLPGHRVIERDAQGRERAFSTPGDRLDAVLGLAVDAPRGRLCAVSTNGFEASAKQQRRNAVVCWALADGKRLARYEAPAALQFNDLAFGADGTIFVTDSEAGSLWRVRPGDAAPSLVGAAGALRGANGLAVLPGREAVYVAISTGIARVDPQTAELQRLAQPDSVVSGAIDGLYAWRGHLVGIHNATSPGRVVRLDLAPDGRSMVGAATLQSHHHPEFDEPTTGALVGDALFVIANSSVGRYQPDGSLRDAASIRAARVIAVPLR